MSSTATRRTRADRECTRVRPVPSLAQGPRRRPRAKEIPAAEAAAAEAEAEAKALAEEAAGEASRKPPLPKLDASLEGRTLRGAAGCGLPSGRRTKRRRRAARARRAAEREKAELARAKRAARLAALEAETSGVPSASVPAPSAEGSGDPGVRAEDGEGDPAKPPSGVDETAEKKSGAQPVDQRERALDPLKAETDPKGAPSR